MSESRYLVRPKADRDLEDQAYYYATQANAELGHRFLDAAHDTFALLATQPNMGWRAHLRHAGLESMRVFRVKGFEKGPYPLSSVADGPEILRVVHGSRNLEAMLRREGVV